MVYLPYLFLRCWLSYLVKWRKSHSVSVNPYQAFVNDLSSFIQTCLCLSTVDLFLFLSTIQSYKPQLVSHGDGEMDWERARIEWLIISAILVLRSRNSTTMKQDRLLWCWTSFEKSLHFFSVESVLRQDLFLDVSVIPFVYSVEKFSPNILIGVLVKALVRRLGTKTYRMNWRVRLIPLASF